MNKKLKKGLAILLIFVFCSSTVYASDGSETINEEVPETTISAENEEGNSPSAIQQDTASEEQSTEEDADIYSEETTVMEEEPQIQVDDAVVTEMKSVVAANAGEKTVDEIELYSLKFMRKSQPGHDIQIHTIDPMYDIDDNITGYYVTFIRDGIPAGYILISFLHAGSPVVELSLDGLGIKENASKARMFTDTGKIRYVGPDQIYAENLANEGTYSCLYEDKVCDTEELESQYDTTLSVLNEQIEETAQISGDGEISTMSIRGGIINWDAGNLDPSSIYKIPNFGSGSSYWITGDFTHLVSDSHCSPTAGTNILYYYGWQFSSNPNNNVKVRGSYSVNSIFSILYNGMNTNGDSEFPGTFHRNIPNGFKSFFGTAAGQGDWNYRETGGFFDNFNTIIENCPISLSVRSGDRGHTMFAMGRARSNTGNSYIMVLDGWHKAGRLVINNYYSKISGFKIWVRV